MFRCFDIFTEGQNGLFCLMPTLGVWSQTPMSICSMLVGFIALIDIFLHFFFCFLKSDFESLLSVVSSFS